MATQIKLRRDTYQNWYDNNPVLGLAEPGFDTTNKKLKIGDGTTAWRSLNYFDDQQTDLTTVAQDIIPDADNTRNIGSPDRRWQHGYFASGSLYVGDIKLSNDNGRLLVQQVTDAGLITEEPIPNTPGVVTTDRIVNGNLSASLNNKGTLVVPHMFPLTFTATVDDAHYAGTLTLTDTAWSFDVTFTANSNGTVTTEIANSTPWPSNPGYTNDMEFTFTEADHGVPGYTFTLTLTDIQNPGQGMYTTNLAANQPPVYPATISNGEAIKLVADASPFIFGADGKIHLPTDGDIVDSTGTSVLGGGGAGDRLVNGLHELVLDANGNLVPPTKTTTSYNGGINTAPTLTLGTLGSDTVITQPETDSVNTGDYAIRIQGQRGFGTWGNNTGNGGWGGPIQIWAGLGGESGGDLSSVRGGEGGYIDLRGGDGQAGRDGGDIYLRGGDTNYSIGYTGTVYGGNVDISAGNATNSIETNFGEGGNVIITAGLGNKINGNIQFNAGQGSWRFNADGSFSINGNEVSVATNNWGISIGGGVGATGIVYTATQLDLASIRAHVTIEGNEDGDATGIHTQACDVMVVRRVAIGGAVTVDAVVYGVIYTGAAPLATLDAHWNPIGGPNASGRIEITATPTSATNNVYVKVYATEVARGD